MGPEVVDSVDGNGGIVEERGASAYAIVGSRSKGICFFSYRREQRYYSALTVFSVHT